MNPNLTKTLVLVEDRRFYKHWGIDPYAIIRALLVNYSFGRRMQGGSTITQQLARTLYLHNRKTIVRKLLEIAVAFYLEFKFSKEEILEMYMKEIYMGQYPNGSPIKGIADASRHYFNKDLGIISVSELAALVAMVKGPNIYKPKSYLGIARRILVLSKMLDSDIIDQEMFFEASKVEL